MRDFPGSPVVKTLSFHCSGVQVPSLVGKQRFCMLHSAAEKKKKCLTNEFIYKTETDLQIKRTDLWLLSGEVREEYIGS